MSINAENFRIMPNILTDPVKHSQLYKKLSIFGGLVYFGSYGERFILFEYLKLKNNQYRRVDLQATVCVSCGWKGRAIVAAYNFVTLPSTWAKVKQDITNQIKVETSSDCPDCSKPMLPVKRAYSWISESEYTAYMLKGANLSTSSQKFHPNEL